MQITEDILYFWLGISGLSSRRTNALLSRYTPVELWEGVGNTVTDEALFGEKAYAALLRYRNVDFLARELDALHNMGITVVSRNRYGEPLAQKEVDAPAFLYCRGNTELLTSDCVAVVGTRACSLYGKDATRKIVTELCNWRVTVVSGLASGVDTYAHRATLAAGGKTIAVLGSGLNCVTPPSNAGLAEEILAAGGLIVSEYAPRCPASRYTFPERNRIISGLSMGTVVVEAASKSGALITAEYAAEQGRTVFVVPGNITSVKSAGSNRLLADGAIPALDGEGIVTALGWQYKKIAAKPRAVALDIFEQKIYNILQSGEMRFDDLVQQSGLAPQKLSAMLSALEIKGAVVKQQANIYAIA